MATPEFLFFDLGRVLLNFDHEIAVRQLSELANCSADRIRELVFESALQSDYESGRITTQQFCKHFRAETKSNVSDSEICLAASEIFQPNESIVPVVGSLCQAGYRMGILSNTCDAHWSYIRKTGYQFINLFDPFVLSYEVGCSKPDSAIYQSAARMAGVDPGLIFFVDDLPANVQGAVEAGFDAVLYTSARQLISDLRTRGLRFNL